MYRPEIVKVSGPLDALQKKKKMKEILKESVPVDLDNIISFDSLSNEVFAEFANVEQVTGVKVSRSFGSNHFIYHWSVERGKTDMISTQKLFYCTFY